MLAGNHGICDALTTIEVPMKVLVLVLVCVCFELCISFHNTFAFQRLSVILNGQNKNLNQDWREKSSSSGYESTKSAGPQSDEGRSNSDLLESISLEDLGDDELIDELAWEHTWVLKVDEEIAGNVFARVDEARVDDSIENAIPNFECLVSKEIPAHQKVIIETI